MEINGFTIINNELDLREMNYSAFNRFMNADVYWITNKKLNISFSGIVDDKE